MHALSMWRMLISETVFAPTPWTWLVLLVPPVFLALAVLITRQQEKKPILNGLGAWKRLGQRWSSVGLGLLVITGVLYAGDILLTRKYDARHASAIERRVSGAATNRDRKSAVRELANDLPEQALTDFAKDFVQQLDKPSRIKFIEGWLASDAKGTIVQFYELLNWPDDRVNEYKRENNGLAPLVTATGLIFDQAQLDLFGRNRWPDLYESLREPQWRYLTDQFLLGQQKPHLISLLSTLCDYMPAAKAEELYSGLRDRKFAKADPATRLAWLVGNPRTVNVFRFFIENVRWLRALPEAVIYGGLSLWILLTGLVITQQGGRAMFQDHAR
jgi:hypothetical protein